MSSKNRPYELLFLGATIQEVKCDAEEDMSAMFTGESRIALTFVVETHAWEN